MAAFVGSVVGNLINGLEWLFFSTPAWAWYAAAAAVAVLGIWALGSGDFLDEISETCTAHSLASSFGMGYLFMLVTEAIHKDQWGYAFVRLAKKGVTFSAFDPSTWHLTFCIFLILLLVVTLSALFLAGGVSFRQIVLTIMLDLLWAVVVRFLLADSLALVQAVLRFGMSVVIFFGTPVSMLLSIAFIFANPQKAIRDEQSRRYIERQNNREIRRNMPTTLTLPDGSVVHKSPDFGDDRPLSYYYGNHRSAFNVTDKDIVTLPNGQQELVIRRETDDEPVEMRIPLTKPIHLMGKDK